MEEIAPGKFQVSRLKGIVPLVYALEAYKQG
jgi:hypothetical protein